MQPIKGEFNKEIKKTLSLSYLVYLPKAYGEAGSKWPLIVFLHGVGERGSDADKVRVTGFPSYLDQQEDFPFVALCPQCPDGSVWPQQLDSFTALLDETMDKYDIDPDRVYLTGLSMGGYGTWELGMALRDRFAAIAPICGSGAPWRAHELKGMPVWTFHGAKDDAVPIHNTEDMVRALKNAGNDVKFTVYPEAGHDSWTETYRNPELYEWFLQHKRAAER